MNLREARDNSQFAKSFTATKLYCAVREQTINVSSEFGCVIELKGVIESHSEWNSEPWEDDEDMPLRNLAFSCKITSEEPEAGVDDEGDEITAQVFYNTGNEEFSATVDISIWEKDNTFNHLLKMTRDSLKKSNMDIAINLSTNVSFCELIASDEIDKTWHPINAWDFYFSNSK